MNTKFAVRFATLVLSLALTLGIAPRAFARITTNGNGGPTDVGTWYLPGPYTGPTNNWSGIGINYLPLSYWTTISGSHALSGTYETFNPSDPSIISEDLAALAAARVDFIVIDLTNDTSANIANGCSSIDWIVVRACDVAKGANIWNTNNSWKIRYSIAVGTVGGGGTIEQFAQAVYTGFVADSAFGGIGNTYRINGQPLLVLYNGGASSGPGYCVGGDGSCTYSTLFYFGNADNQGAGQWGWSPTGLSYRENGGKGPPVPTQVDPKGVVEEVSPGWFSNFPGWLWAPREDGAFYQGNWNVVFSNPLPRIVLLSGYDDWAESQGVWPTDTLSPRYIPSPIWDITQTKPHGDAINRMDEAWTFPDQNNHPDGYWNYTLAAICYLRNNTSTNCGINSSPLPVLPQPAPNLAVRATSSASSTLNGSWAASNVNDGNPGTAWSSQNDGTTNPSNPEWIQLTWPTAQTLNTVVLMGRPDIPNCYPVSFQIQYLNGGGWHTVVTETNFPQETIPGQPIAFDWGSSVTTTEVRVLVTQLSPDQYGGHYAQLGEFEVFNEGSTATMPVLANWGFETPAQVGPKSQANPAGADWTFSGNSGVQESGSGYHAPMAPQGIQTGYLTGSSSSISQAITLPAGTYTLRFLAAETDGQSQTINVSYGSTKIGSFGSFPSASFGPYTTNSFKSTGGSQTITFTGTSSGTAFINEVQIFNQSPISTGGSSNLLTNPWWGTGSLNNWSVAYADGGSASDAYVQGGDLDSDANKFGHGLLQRPL